MSATTPAQHLAMFGLYTDKAANFRLVAGSLGAAGDEATADLLRSYAEGFDIRAGDAILEAAEAVKAQRAGGGS